MVSFDDFVEWLSDSWVFDKKIKITRNTSIEKDLKITGDDGADLLLDIEKQFNVNFIGSDGTIREAFGLRENEYLFHSEGCDDFSFLKKWFGKEDAIIPLTVGQLYNATLASHKKNIYMHTKEEKMEAFGRLLDIMDELRVKCPWDAEQTNESLRTNTIEETYELCEAIIKDDNNEIKKELGDVMLHIVFYSKIGEEKKAFDVADVCNTLCDKLIFRHPHVFGDDASKTAGEVEKTWEQIKLKEKGGNKTVLEGVPASLPSIAKAHRIQDKARNAGFDWKQKEDVWDKVAEELNELKTEINSMNDDKMEAEFGDLFFSLINAARLYKVNPDNALERTNQKFIRRFNYIEQKAKEQEKILKNMTLEEMDSLWDEAKRKEFDK